MKRMIQNVIQILLLDIEIVQESNGGVIQMIQAHKSGISSANLVCNRQRWVREHPMERRNGPTTVALPSG